MRAALVVGLGWLCVWGMVAVNPNPLSAAELASPETSLDRYVAQPDPTYAWELVKTVPGEGVTTYVIDLKSQTWRKEPEVSRAVWQHYLLIGVPTEVKYETGFLFISGGGNNGQVPEGPDGMIPAFAKASQSVVAELKQVPNQPLVFHEDGKKRSEDDLIGYTWDQFMKTGDDTWPARLPMVKSAVRAMDTITAFLASEAGGQRTVNKFMVAGGSKRGWTTWLTAAVDPRVVAIAPAVIDVLNVRQSMQHHHDAYGFWAPAVWNYVQHKIVNRKDTPEHAALMAIEDPYSYRARLTLPKFIVNAAGDEFFLPDSSQFYFGDLVGEKHLRYVANAKHSLAGSDARESILAFYLAILKNKPRPEFTWTRESDGSLRVTVKEKPARVELWAATNPKARDFRLDAIGKAYQATELTDQGGGVYVAQVPQPESGWTAFFVELTFDVGEAVPLKFTTEVRVTPDTLPHAENKTAAGGE